MKRRTFFKGVLGLGAASVIPNAQAIEKIVEDVAPKIDNTKYDSLIDYGHFGIQRILVHKDGEQIPVHVTVVNEEWDYQQEKMIEKAFNYDGQTWPDNVVRDPVSAIVPINERSIIYVSIMEPKYIYQRHQFVPVLNESNNFEQITLHVNMVEDRNYET